MSLKIYFLRPLIILFIFSVYNQPSTETSFKIAFINTSFLYLHWTDSTRISLFIFGLHSCRVLFWRKKKKNFKFINLLKNILFLGIISREQEYSILLIVLSRNYSKILQEGEITIYWPLTKHFIFIVNLLSTI